MACKLFLADISDAGLPFTGQVDDGGIGDAQDGARRFFECQFTLRHRRHLSLTGAQKKGTRTLQNQASAAANNSIPKGFFHMAREKPENLMR